MNNGCPPLDESNRNLPLPLRRKGQARDELIRARRPVPWQVRLYFPRPPEKIS